MTLVDIFAQEEERKKRKYPINPEHLKKILKGRHRVTDFIIYPCSSILYRDPYSFVYLESGETLGHRVSTSELGYCPFHTQFGIGYLLSSAKNYLIGCKYSKEIYEFAMEAWKKKKKKNAKQKPQKQPSCYGIAKNTHFFIEVEGLGMFYFQMVYQRRKK